jgi:hypothetical protein
VSRGASLDLVSPEREWAPALSVARLLLPLGWLLAAAGYFGPWIGHPTAALALTGVDLGEFVKFLPDVQSGAVPVTRQLFYLPPLAVVLGVALLVWAPRLRYGAVVRGAALALAVPVSLQLMPPAWSPASLMGAEFRLQMAALAVCWLALATSWLLGRLPAWLLGGAAALLATGALGASLWQMSVVKLSIDALYGQPPAPGWGLYVCSVGLAVMLVSGTMIAARGRRSRARSGREW